MIHMQEGTVLLPTNAEANGLIQTLREMISFQIFSMITVTWHLGL